MRLPSFFQGPSTSNRSRQGHVHLSSAIGFAILSAAGVHAGPVDCDEAWRLLTRSHSDIVANWRDRETSSTEQFRYGVASDAFKLTADYVTAVGLERVGLGERGFFADVLIETDAIMTCNSEPIVDGTASAAFQATFDQFNAAYPEATRSELLATYGEFR